jgi:hypothetical protein
MGGSISFHCPSSPAASISTYSCSMHSKQQGIAGALAQHSIVLIVTALLAGRCRSVTLPTAALEGATCVAAHTCY